MCKIRKKRVKYREVRSSRRLNAPVRLVCGMTVKHKVEEEEKEEEEEEEEEEEDMVALRG